MSVPNRYAIKEVFNTLQGEGARAGTRAVFVRFAGCNLWNGHPLHRHEGSGPCAQWCDTDFFKGKPREAAALLEEMEQEWPPYDGPRWCVLTGGEPALQVDKELVDALHGNGWRVAVETNGTLDNAAIRTCDHVCLSPKRGTDWKKLGFAHEVKVILPGAAPGLPGWTEEELVEIESAVEESLLYVQPQDPILAPDVVEATFLKRNAEQPTDDLFKLLFARHLDQCIQWTMEHPSWRLSLQTHKLSNLP